MIEDRKFFYPIKDEFNPWAKAIVGTGAPFPLSQWFAMESHRPPGTVTMDEANPRREAHPWIRLTGDGKAAGIRKRDSGS